jgi:type VI protein secretion system component VasK
MFEIFKILWDLFVLRDAARKGQMNWRIWVIAISFVLFLYGTGLPVALLYQKNPNDKTLFIATLALDGLVFVWFMVWGIRRYLRQMASAKSVSEAQKQD